MTLSLSRTKTTQRIIDLNDSFPDITANLIQDSEHSQLPSDIFEKLIFEALNDLVDESDLPCECLCQFVVISLRIY